VLGSSLRNAATQRRIGLWRGAQAYDLADEIARAIDAVDVVHVTFAKATRITCAVGRRSSRRKACDLRESPAALEREHSAEMRMLARAFGPDSVRLCYMTFRFPLS